MAETSPVYDEVLHEVSSRIQKTGSIGKTDIGALVFWKRLRANTRWVPELMNMSEQDVRAITAQAVTAVNNGSVTTPQAASDGRRALSAMPGFRTGDALASALLLAAAPHRMAVYGTRAQKGLKAVGLTLPTKPGRYRRYMELVEGLCMEAQIHGEEWTARDVDVALYKLGGPKKRTGTGSDDSVAPSGKPVVQSLTAVL